MPSHLRFLPVFHGKPRKRTHLSRLSCTGKRRLHGEQLGQTTHGLEATGDPVFNRIGTVLNLPCITLPGLHGRNGLPIGIQLMGPVWQDAATLRAAHWAHQSLLQ